jgi:hypothetical protein
MDDEDFYILMLVLGSHPLLGLLPCHTDTHGGRSVAAEIGTPSVKVERAPRKIARETKPPWLSLSLL